MGYRWRRGSNSRKERWERMQVEQVGAGRRGNSLTPPGAMSPGTREQYGVQGGSGPGADAELQLSSSCGLLPPLGHAAYTCTCWFRTARPGATPPSCWACLPLGLGEPRVSSTRGGKVSGGEPQHPVSTWLPSEVLEHWEQSHNHQDRDHSGAGSSQARPSRAAACGVGFGMGRVWPERWS